MAVCFGIKSVKINRLLLLPSTSSSFQIQPAFFQHSFNMMSTTPNTTSMNEQASNSKEDVSEKENNKETLRYATRGKLLTKQQQIVEEQKEKIISLSILEKRKLYLCKHKYTELKDVPQWPEYFSTVLEPHSSTEKWWKIHKNEVTSDVNSDLNSKISIFRGDITTLEIDAIVNAANESLLGGGGVDGCIHRAAGLNLRQECELLNGCSPGNAKITCGYKLPAKHVIHTVGPRGERPEVLQNCYQNSLDLLRDNELTTIAFPCISTGIFGYPNLNAAKVALKTIRHWLETEEYSPKVERILFCLFLEKDVDIYQEQLQLFFPLKS